MYPNCTCKYGLFSKQYSHCVHCPRDSDGVYPNCKCHQADRLFSAYLNQCYIECPDDSAGIHPDCECNDTSTYYHPTERICKSNVGRKCPKNSIGIGPDCLCIETGRTFYENLWQCTSHESIFYFPTRRSCPEKTDKFPQCEILVDHNILLTST